MTPRPDSDDPAQERLLPMSEEFAGWVEKNDARPLPKLRNAPHPHTVLVKATVEAMRRLPGQKIVRKRPVGRYIVTDGNGNPRKISGNRWQYVRVAVSGDADVEVLWTPPGQKRPLVVMLECKTGAAVLSEDQKDARDEAVALGCHHLVVRDAAEAFKAVLALGKSA